MQLIRQRRLQFVERPDGLVFEDEDVRDAIERDHGALGDILSAGQGRQRRQRGGACNKLYFDCHDSASQRRQRFR